MSVTSPDPDRTISTPDTRQTADPPTLGRLLSFPAFLTFALVALTALSVKGRFNDPDLWWHLKLGQVIWSTGSVPTTEIFSHTAAGHAWIPHEWLSQLSIFAAYRLAGYSGLMLWLVLFPSLLVILVYLLCCVESGDSRLSFAGGLIGWFFATVGMAIRPLVLGHLLLVLELLLLHLGRSKDPRWLWGLPFLFALWVNCHPSYSFGLVILGVSMACSFINWETGPIVCRSWPLASRGTRIAVVVTCGCALLLNPIGWRMVTYPINTLLQQHVGLSSVGEWGPLTMLDPRGVGVLLILAVCGLAVAAGWAEIRLEECILVGMTAFLAMQHRRMLFLFGIVAAPVVCRILVQKMGDRTAKKDLPIANAVFIAIAMATIVAAFPTRSQLEAQVEKGNPVGAVEFIRKQQLSGAMLNDYDLGGYLIWALPEHKVFLDGRADVYEWTGVLEAFKRWALLEEDPQLLLNRYDIQFCVLNAGSPMGNVLPYLPGWKMAYRDGRAQVFVRQPAASR